MQNVRTLVVDIDDTISYHSNRDYANAKPDLAMIEKLNNLYDTGWDIVYFTARGQVSCDGNLELILETKGKVLKNWLHANGVKFTKLLFGKPLGFYYIDDKAMQPSEFLKADFSVLAGGSGAFVERAGNRVLKQGSGLKHQFDWYRMAYAVGLNVPKCHNYFGDTLDIDYIDGANGQYGLSERLFPQVFTAIDTMRNSYIDLKYADWSTMVSRVREHLALNSVPFETEILKIIDSQETHRYMNSRKSFSHGDLTISNMIVDEFSKVFIIDSNFHANVYSSYIMDTGKLLQSLNKSYEETFLGYPANHDKPAMLKMLKNRLSEGDYRYSKLAEIIHYIRMVKYKSDEEKKLVLNIIKELYNDYVKPNY